MWNVSKICFQYKYEKHKILDEVSYAKYVITFYCE